MAVLPKKRVASSQSGRSSSAVLHDLSNKGRVLSGRSLSGQKRKESSTRHVSRGDMFVANNEDDPNGSFAEDAVKFHENKSKVLSNFEEWIKLSTDNKITTKNSWQFALIDYFHDLNVIKDGDNINFQRASATLDGCVKIYSSRVESAASETGKLLSGLATKKGQEDLEKQVDGEASDAEDDADPSSSRKERRINRVVESTLVPFETIQIKKLDQELAIDPLFKKALADFDEGGAKSLLLNTLNIDAAGRVVFDATTNSHKSKDSEETPQPQTQSGGSNVNISKLSNFLFEKPDFDTLSICPSVKELKMVLEDVNQAKTILGDVNNRLMSEEQEEWQTPAIEDQAVFPDYDFDLEGADADGPEEEYHNTTSDRALGPSSLHQFEMVPESTETVLDNDLMAYFDEKMKTNWRGPEHWKVTALKSARNLNAVPEASAASNSNDAAAPQEGPKRKRKEHITVNFFEEDDADYLEDIFQKAKNPAQISRKVEEDESANNYLLPDDIQFNSQKLVTLFLKPSKTILTFSRRAKADANIASEDVEEVRAYTDENFFAGKYLENAKEREEEERQERLAASFHQAEMEDYDNDNYGGIDFNDVLGGEDERGSVDPEVKKEDFGSQLITGGRKARPEYVNFSRVAKRVDVKLLKDNLWKSIKSEPVAKEKSAVPEGTPEPKREKKFKDIVDVVGSMYREEEKKDLSTSFCFICILHLANEHGLSIETSAEHDDLRIVGF